MLENGCHNGCGGGSNGNAQKQWHLLNYSNSLKLFYFKLTDLVMVALCNRADHHIFILFLYSSSFFSSPNLSGQRLDVYHTLAHGVALVRI